METLQDLVKTLETKEGIAKSWKTKQGEKQTFTFKQYYDKIQNLSQGFLDLGVKQGDHVSFIADNSPNWSAISLALNNIGAVDVPRGTDSSNDELEYIVKHSDSDFLIVKDDYNLDRFSNRLSGNIKEKIVLTGSKGLNIDEIEIAGQSLHNSFPLVQSDDLSTIIYTSGTTGEPKGVMLSHGNQTFTSKALIDFEGLTKDDVWMSILPPWHIFERAAEQCGFESGAEMFHSSVGTLPRDLLDINPTIFPSVPRVWISMYDKAIKAIGKKLGKTLVPSVIPNLIMPSSVKSLIDEKLGGNLRMAISGGSALPSHVDKFFSKGGVDVREGYGGTETTAVLSARIGRGKIENGTVGPALTGVELKIANPDTNERIDDWKIGEVQASGPNIMLGYYKNQEATDEVIYTEDSGQRWFKTGDRGYFDKHDNLILKGRYKETIIGSDGENIDPVQLEDRLNKSMLISQSVVIPGDKNSLYALVVPDFDEITQFCEKHNLPTAGGIESMLQEEEVKKLLGQEIKKYNKDAKLTHRINDVTLVDRALEIGRGLTNTYKIKRAEVQKIYKKEIHKLVKN